MKLYFFSNDDLISLLNEKLGFLPFFQYLAEYYHGKIHLTFTEVGVAIYHNEDSVYYLPSSYLSDYAFDIEGLTIDLEKIQADQRQELKRLYSKLARKKVLLFEVAVTDDDKLVMKVLTKKSKAVKVTVPVYDYTNDWMKKISKAFAYDYSDSYDSDHYVQNDEDDYDNGSMTSIKLPSGKDEFVDEENGEDACRICMDRKLCTINLPCGHLYFCIGCANKFVEDHGNKNCPTCNKKIAEIKRFFK